MIKRFLYSFTALLFVAFSFTSCEDTNGDNFRVDTDAGWVQFEDTDEATFVGGYHTTLEVPVVLHTNTNVAGLDVYYTLENIVGDASIIVEDPGFVRFKKGETTAYTQIKVASEIPLSGLFFDLVLSSANRDNIDFLTETGIYLTKPVCVRPIFVGTNYEGEVYIIDVDEDGEYSDPEFTSIITTSLVPTSEEGVYTFGNGAWGSDFVPAASGQPGTGHINYPAEITISPDGTVVIDGLVFDPDHTEQGNEGSINSCSGEITYILEQGLFANPFVVQVVIRPID